jgi:predicted hydrocarbon binding protein
MMKLPKKKNKHWVAGLHEGISKMSDDSKRKLMAISGKQCAQDLLNLIDKLMNIKVQNIKELISAWNSIREMGKLDGKWIMEDDLIYGVFDKCSCPLINSGLIDLHPVQCYCSHAMLQEIFSKIAKTHVNVEIVRSIGRGDDVCEFRITNFMP